MAVPNCSLQPDCWSGGHIFARRYASYGTALTFLSHGWCIRIRPSLSHLTTASSSFVRSTVPNSPVGLPKFPRPSTRSPGFRGSPVAEGSASGGLLARSESGTAPRCDSGGWGALRSFRTGRFVASVIFDCFLCFFASGKRLEPRLVIHRQKQNSRRGVL